MKTKQNKRNIRSNRKKIQKRATLAKTNQQLKVSNEMFKNTGLSVKSFNNDTDFENYFQELGNKVSDQWKSLYDIMSPYNVDLGMAATPLLDTTFKPLGQNKKMRCMITEDAAIVGSLNHKYNKSADYIIQLFDVKSNASTILLLNYRKDANINWRGEALPLSKAEMALTSWLLDTSEGKTGHPFYVVDDIVKTVADKHLFGNVFSVLN